MRPRRLVALAGGVVLVSVAALLGFTVLTASRIHPAGTVLDAVTAEPITVTCGLATTHSFEVHRVEVDGSSWFTSIAVSDPLGPGEAHRGTLTVLSQHGNGYRLADSALFESDEGLTATLHPSPGSCD